MATALRRIGGQNLEGRFFIIAVPDEWTETDPLPLPAPDDMWFDRLTDFKAALDCPWIRRPLRHNPYVDAGKSAGQTHAAMLDQPDRASGT